MNRTSNASAFLSFLVLAAVPALAEDPATPVERFSREADEARDAILASLGPTRRPATEFPDLPPVAEADDPVAALDPAALEAERESFTQLQRMLRRDDGERRRHPLTEDEVSLVRSWFATHTNFTAAADAVSASSDYRSCLGGSASFQELSEAFKPIDPRVRDALDYSSAIQLRARAALASGDSAAGPDAFARLENVFALFDREPATIQRLCGLAVRSFENDLLAERIDLWSDEALLAAEHLADADAAGAESRFREVLAFEAVVMDEVFHGSRAETLSTISPNLPAGRAFDNWIAFERRAYFRNLAVSLERLREVVAAPGGEPPGNAFDRLEKDEDARNRSLPPMAKMLSASVAELWSSFVMKPRTRASFVHAAVAIERYRRAHGAPPPSLEALVPAYLPAIPVEARTGEAFRYEPGPLEIPEETLPTRSLPAANLPGFRLIVPDPRGREDGDMVYDFSTSSTPSLPTTP